MRDDFVSVGLERFYDPIDVTRRHWQDKSGNQWNWLPAGTPYDIASDLYDDHEEQYDSLGVEHWFDPHFADFWKIRWSIPGFPRRDGHSGAGGNALNAESDSLPMNILKNSSSTW